MNVKENVWEESKSELKSGLVDVIFVWQIVLSVWESVIFVLMGKALLEVISHPTLYGPARDNPYSGQTSFSYICLKNMFLVPKFEITAFLQKEMTH